MTQGRFAAGGLYGLLPSVIQHRDSLIGEPLRQVLEKFGEEADELEYKIAQSYAGFFVETCSERELVLIADLIDYRPKLEPPPQEAPSAGADLPPKLSLRRDIAKTIWARRRKGTPDVLGGIVEHICGWHTATFENNRCVVATPSVRFTGIPRSQGAPDLRKLVGRQHVDQGPGLVPHVATVRRIDSHAACGRWHPLDVVLEVWPQRARVHDERLVRVANRTYLTIGPGDGMKQLYGPAGSEAQTSDFIESARALRISDFAGDASFKEEVYGSDKAVCLYYRLPRKDVVIDGGEVAFGRIDARFPGDPWIIDPESGRIQPPAKLKKAPVYFRCYLASQSYVRAEIDPVLKTRLADHVPMEARTGTIDRS